jgi:predicted transcriptional regulator of viral defense system
VKGCDFLNTYEKILNFIKENKGIISNAEFVKLGIDKKYLSLMVQKGLIERASRGVYILPDVIEDEFYSINIRCRKGVFSHDTALFLHDLSDRTPLSFSMTLPKGYNPSSLIDLSLEFFYVNPGLHNLGKIMVLSPHGKEIYTYDIERTICDIVRSKSRMDMQIFTDALKRYPKRKDKNLSNLIRYAKEFKIEQKIREYMEVLI